MWGIAGACNTCPVVYCTTKWCYEMSSEFPSNKGRFLIRYSYDTTWALRMLYDVFFSVHIAPNTIETARCLNGSNYVVKCTSRTGGWLVGISDVFIKNVAIFLFITNRTNYSRWMPVYILDMLELPAEIKSAFEKGELSIRQTCGGIAGACNTCPVVHCTTKWCYEMSSEFPSNKGRFLKRYSYDTTWALRIFYLLI
jgi:hypothetical protein